MISKRVHWAVIPWIGVLSLMSLSACNASSSFNPQRVEVICPQEPEALTQCAKEQALKAFEDWFSTALPDSTFSLWVAGQQRREVEKIVTIYYPASFQPGAIADKIEPAGEAIGGQMPGGA